jgi:hypothetical protein
MIEELFWEVVSIVFRHPSNSPDSVEDVFQFKPLSLISLSAIQKIHWPVNCCPVSAPFMRPKSQKSEGSESEQWLGRDIRTMPFSAKKGSQAFRR